VSEDRVVHLLASLPDSFDVGYCPQSKSKSAKDESVTVTAA